LAASKRRWWDRSGFADRLARHAPDLDLVVIALDEKPPPCRRAPAIAVRRWKNGVCSSRVRRRRRAVRHHYRGHGMQWLMAFEPPTW
jgi:two-component system sensor histidine kinase KdpD